MKTIAIISALTLFSAMETHAQSRVDALCGPGHQNEAVDPQDIRANPDGYYVQSLAEQVSHGDPRIVTAVGQELYICSSPAARPDMDTARAYQSEATRRVKYLFVPMNCHRDEPTS